MFTDLYVKVNNNCPTKEDALYNLFATEMREAVPPHTPDWKVCKMRGRDQNLR